MSHTAGTIAQECTCEESEGSLAVVQYGISCRLRDLDQSPTGWHQEVHLASLGLRKWKWWRMLHIKISKRDFFFCSRTTTDAYTYQSRKQRLWKQTRGIFCCSACILINVRVSFHVCAVNAKQPPSSDLPVCHMNKQPSVAQVLPRLPRWQQCSVQPEVFPFWEIWPFCGNSCSQPQFVGHQQCMRESLGSSIPLVLSFHSIF